MPWFKADLHVHSCLSPCGDLASSPRRLVEAARDRGIDLLALTDHNSALNCPAFDHHARGAGLPVLFGMEASSAEDTHCLCLFSRIEDALDFGDWVYPRLAEVINDPEAFGDQVYVDENEDILGEVDKLLIGTTDRGISDLCAEVQGRGGLFIPAHVDRGAFSCLSQLGYVPPLPVRGLEILHRTTTLASLRVGGPRASLPVPDLPPLSPAQADGLWEACDKAGYALHVEAEEALVRGQALGLLADSDAHSPEDLGQRASFFWSPDPRPEPRHFAEALNRGLVFGAWRVAGV